VTELSGIKPHDQACAEIAAWRGRCIDLYCRGERVVATPKQKQAVQAALEAWADVESRRASFAHGVAIALLDKNGTWHVQLDFVAYRSNRADPCRWNLSRSEAESFEARLAEAFKQLSSQLGQVKKRLSS